MRHLKCPNCKKRTPHYKEQYKVLKMDGTIEYSMYEDYWLCSVCRKQFFKHPCQSPV